MELSNADINFLKQLCRHIELYCDYIPPMGMPNKAYNAYRLLKRQDLPKLQRKLSKWTQEK